jgi:nitric-oxide synthase
MRYLYPLQLCLKLGWKSPRGRFDVMPLVLQADGMDPELFVIPDELILQIKLTHPE